MAAVIIPSLDPDQADADRRWPDAASRRPAGGRPTLRLLRTDQRPQGHGAPAPATRTGPQRRTSPTLRATRPSPQLRTSGAVGPSSRVVAPSPQRRTSPAVYRRRRLAVAGLAAVALLGVWLAVHALTASPRAGSAGVGTPAIARDAAVRVYTVRPGDTLWAIASRLQPRGDVRPLVQRLSAEVHGRPLTVGQQITVP